MRFLGPTRNHRLNEVVGGVFLLASFAVTLSLVSYHPGDPSWNTASASQPENLIGRPGAIFADWFLQVFGLASFTLPVLLILMAWKWVRSQAIEAATAKVIGALMLLGAVSTGISLGPEWRPFGDLAAGGLLGRLAAGMLLAELNLTGSLLMIAGCLFVSLYLVSSFSLAHLPGWLVAPFRSLARTGVRWKAWYAARRLRKEAEAAERSAARLRKAVEPRRRQPGTCAGPEIAPGEVRGVFPVPDSRAAAEAMPEPEPEEIPIRTLEELPPELRVPAHSADEAPPFDPGPPPLNGAVACPASPPAAPEPEGVQRVEYRLPPTALLNEATGRPAYDSAELQEIAARVKSKFEEFHVLGNVVQINPGPVVTTFEFKPEAGIKYSRITTLSEDLCLGLHAESILIQRIPGKPTVGIEVPNKKREVIALRQILESEEFQEAPYRLSISLGKDVAGRIKVAALESMPHLLIAGSTGSGKSVMLNSLIMSVLYKSTPEEVRMIMVDPKRVELGIYEGVPHLLTPVITDPRKASNALRNAVLEMERRLKLLASQGVRNIDQFNKKVERLRNGTRSLFPPEETGEEELKPLPYVLILIDELADLMMVERANVEETVIRLAQMARAVGMHLVLATQRPSVDVITGLIKANFPARISFRVATRVDSRTILDVMGAEHLLGRGDMLFLPPGSSRLVRVHGALVTEAEINRVVDFWKRQAQPEYDDTYLMAPPSEDGEPGEGDEFDGGEDPMYQDAVRVVVEMGKASTSTLQRRLKLGYGRAARILDMMYRDGIIGPPDGPRPREVLKRPDWLDEVEQQVR